MKKNIMRDIEDISKRLIELRTFSDISTTSMAGLLGIDEEEYIRFESGEDEISINLIYRFASILGTESSYVLNGTMPSKESANVVYDGRAASVKRYEGYSFTSLASDFKNKTMNPMIVVISPTENPELVVHNGQEFNFVLEGELRVIVDTKDYFLSPGDSIYFNSSFPHAQLAMNNKAAKFLTVISQI